MPEVSENTANSPDAPLDLQQGTCYLIRGKNVDTAYRLLRRLTDQGVPALCVSRIFPARVRQRYGIERATTWWLSHSPGEGRFDPTAISSLANRIEAFVAEHPEQSVVLLDGLEYIMNNVGFDKALLFLEHLNEFVMPRTTIVLVPVDPACFDASEFARLERYRGGLDEEALRKALDAAAVPEDIAVL